MHIGHFYHLDESLWPHWCNIKMRATSWSLPCTALILLCNCINDRLTFFLLDSSLLLLTQYKGNKLWEALSYFHKMLPQNTHHLWCYNKHIDLALNLPAVKLASRVKLTFTQVLYYMLEHKNSQSILQSTSCYLDKLWNNYKVQLSISCLLHLQLEETFPIPGWQEQRSIPGNQLHFFNMYSKIGLYISRPEELAWPVLILIYSMS